MLSSFWPDHELDKSKAFFPIDGTKTLSFQYLTNELVNLLDEEHVINYIFWFK